MRTALLAVVVAVTAGCAPQHRGEHRPWPSLTDHPQPLVRGPARVGAVVGALVTLPTIVAGLPITVPIAEAKRQPLMPVVPWVVATEIASDACAAPTWLLFGWWRSAGDGPALHPACWGGGRS